MSLAALYQCTRSLETIENYVRVMEWRLFRHRSRLDSLKNRSLSSHSDGRYLHSRTTLLHENLELYL